MLKTKGEVDEMPKVSIIVPVYKVEDYLVQCLESIVNQTLKDIEIIIVDEGDMDRCREIIDYYEKNDSRIVAIHEHNGGYGNSVNAGIARATGEYIGIVESDDFIEPEMYELLYTKAKELDADVVKSAFNNYHSDEKDQLDPMMEVLRRELPKNWAFTLLEYPVMISTHPSIWTGVYKTDWLRSTGIQFLPKGAYLDIKFRFEVLTAARRIAWIDDSTYHWRLTNPTSTTVVWNIGDALERWDYLHAQFEKDPGLWEYLAPYMLREAWMNFFRQYDPHKCTKQQCEKIQQYRALFTDDVIDRCPYLSEKRKDLYLRGDLNVLYWKRCFIDILKKVLNFLRNNEFERLSVAVWLASLITKQCVSAVTVLFVIYWAFIMGIPTLKRVVKIYKRKRG